jgi:heme exporter protein A
VISVTPPVPAAPRPLRALALRAVARRFERNWALRGVDLDVAPGEAVALAGPNGSGKTTLLRVAATLLRPTRGGGAVFGHDLVADAEAARARVGLLAHRTGLYEDLTPFQNLAFASRMLGLGLDRPRIDAMLERVALSDAAHRRVRGLSSGMRRRLALGRLLLAPPALLLLDEPFASFDAAGLALLESVARDVSAGGGSVLVATHDLERAARIVDRTVWLEEGRIAARPEAEGASPGVPRLVGR